jgi:hypothetical protein
VWLPAQFVPWLILNFRMQVMDDFSSHLDRAFETTETIDAHHLDMVLTGSPEVSAVVNGLVNSYVRDIQRIIVAIKPS